MAEIFKTTNKLNTPIMDFMFDRRNNRYNLKNFRVCDEKKKTVTMSLQTSNYRSP